MKMMRDLWLRKNRIGKRAVSLMVGYVLLIVIATALAVAVYSFLQLYLPENKPECPDDLSLIIEDTFCNQTDLKVNLTNKGLFTVERVQIRIGEADRVFRETLNKAPYIFQGLSGELNGLKPDEKWSSPLYFHTFGSGAKEIEIQPAMFIDNNFILCENAIVKKEITC